MDTSTITRQPLFYSLNYVPSTVVTTLLLCQALLLFLSPHISCSRDVLEPTLSHQLDTYDEAPQRTYFAPTPPLGPFKNGTRYRRYKDTSESGSQAETSADNLYVASSPDNLFSPLFDFQLVADNYGLLLAPSRIQPRQLQSQASVVDTTDSWMDSLAGVEPGSGNEVWDEHHENFPGDDSTPANGISPSSVLAAPSNYGQPESTPSMDDSIYNHAPVLNRRLPKLSLVSGQIWKYHIPADTFTDEDGDLTALQSSVFIKTGVDSLLPLSANEDNDNASSSSLDRYFSWIQYNQSSQLLYALPTENNAGNHELVLVASDRWSATGRESLELQVKQHLSVRAFTHLVSFNRVEWERQKYPSIVDVLIRFIERISERIFLSRNTDDFIVKSYTINDFSIQAPNDQETTLAGGYSGTPSEKQTTSLSISWSNSSLPVHPCDLNLLDAYLKPMVNDLDSLGSPNQSTTDLNPSPELIKAMYSDFKISNISVDLRGSCAVGTEWSKLGNSNKPPASTNTTSLRVRMKIGMLTWKLGEPIEYQIPGDTFELEGPGDTKAIQMSLYTIDGMLLDKDSRYSFLEFEEETSTLFGVPYDLKLHSGQRELMLTALHPASGSRAREVFMLNIEPQELTMINNRAFKMSLYFGTRLGEFGPRERILMSHKIVRALRVSGWLEYRLDSPQFIISDIQKFFIPGSEGIHEYSRSQLAKVVREVDEESGRTRDASGGSRHGLHFYKFDWTNSSIGVRGDCPVEVIKENIFFALEQSMLDLAMPTLDTPEDSTKNDSTRFYERLRFYFDPEFDLMHLRFEPLGACQDAIELHEVGNSEVAESVDRLLATDSPTSADLYHQQQELAPPHLQLGTPKIVVEPDSDEYWSIVVLIVLVMVLIFVIVMFFLGIHTYKINQDKKFELQVRLAQARHNSMYLSSMILANQATPADVCLAGARQNEEQIKNAKSMYVIHDEDKKHRKPAVILDNGLSGQQQLDMQQQSSVGLVASSRPNSHLINDTIMHHPFPMIKQPGAQMQPNGWPVQHPSSGLMMDDNNKRLSMTLNRRFSNSIQQKLAGGPTLNHSQSILTVASVGCPVSLVSNVPVVYTPGAGYQTLMANQSLAYLNHQQHPPAELIPQTPNDSVKMYAQQHNKPPLAEPVGKSPSFSSSASGTTHQSVIMNPYYNGANR